MDAAAGMTAISIRMKVTQAEFIFVATTKKGGRGRSLLRPVQPVAGVAQTRPDVAVVV